VLFLPGQLQEINEEKVKLYIQKKKKSQKGKNSMLLTNRDAQQHASNQIKRYYDDVSLDRTHWDK
jgi:hypothetical protein